MQSDFLPDFFPQLTHKMINDRFQRVYIIIAIVILYSLIRFVTKLNWNSHLGFWAFFGIFYKISCSYDFLLHRDIFCWVIIGPQVGYNGIIYFMCQCVPMKINKTNFYDIFLTFYLFLFLRLNMLLSNSTISLTCFSMQ